MIFWDILIYTSIAVCYFGAGFVIYGWVKHGLEEKGKSTNKK